MAISPKAAAEIKRLMLDPDALRDERAPSPGGRGHYDPNQPRVPAGDPRGGQFASKGYRGGDSGLDARVMQASLDAAQLVQFGRGNPRDAYAQVQPFDGQVGNIGAGQHLTSQNAFHRTDTRYDFESYRGRYRFQSTGPFASERIPGGGGRWVISSTTYVDDDATGAYATISATPARPIIVDIGLHDKLVVAPVNPGIRGR